MDASVYTCIAVMEGERLEASLARCAGASTVLSTCFALWITFQASVSVTPVRIRAILIAFTVVQYQVLAQIKLVAAQAVVRVIW